MTEPVDLVEEVCEKCSKTFYRPVGRKQGNCLDCGVASLVNTNTQLRNKEGPIYEKMARKNKLYWQAECARLGIR
jgi:hypothetical protein